MSWNPAFTNNNSFIDTSKYLKMDYKPLDFSGDTSSTGLNDPIPNSDSFMNSMKTKGNAWGSSGGGMEDKGFDSLKMFGAGAQGLSALGSLVIEFS